jgi:acetyl-CoA synthetase
MEFVRDRVAAHLRVRRVEFYELPKTISGKIRRVDLRRREEGAHVAGRRNSAEYRYEDLVG